MVLDDLKKPVKLYVQEERSWRWLWMRRRQRCVFAGFITSASVDHRMNQITNMAVTIEGAEKLLTFRTSQ